MPRRRVTKRPATKRPSPAMPDGDEGRDMDVEHRKTKVRALIRDFKTEVDSRIQQLKAGVNDLLNQIDLAYTMELMKIPVNCRNMKLTDFLKVGGTFEVAPASESIHEKIECLLNSGGADQPLSTAEESEDGAKTGTVRQLRRRKKGDYKTAMPPPTSKQRIRIWTVRRRRTLPAH